MTTENQAPEGGELPPLPPVTWPRNVGVPSWTAEEVQAYARAAQARVKPKDKGALLRQIDDLHRRVVHQRRELAILRGHGRRKDVPAPAEGDELLPEPVAYWFRNIVDGEPASEWRPVELRNPYMDTIPGRVKELRGHTYKGKPCYEVMGVYTEDQMRAALAPKVQPKGKACAMTYTPVWKEGAGGLPYQQSNFGCTACGYVGRHDSHPGCRKPPAQAPAVGAEPREVRHTIKQAGAVVCNGAVTRYESPSCIVLEMDLQSKYCELDASCGHGVFLAATERSLHLDDSRPRDDMTWVEFELPAGKWSFVSGSVSRYTLTCVFLRDADSNVPVQPTGGQQ